MTNEQAPAAAAPAAPAPATPRYEAGSAVLRSAVLRFAVGVIVVALAGLTALIAPLLVMASDSCYDGDARLICSTGGQQTVVHLPLLAAAAAVLLTVRGLYRRRPACVVAAPCVLVLAWVAELILMSI